MELKTFKKLAAVSAVALSVAYAGGAIAAPVQSGNPTTVGVTATVENTIDVAATAAAFGQIAAMADAGDTATMTLELNDTLTDDQSPQASLVSDPADAASVAAAVITITGAFDATLLYVDYATVVDMTDGTDTLEITRLFDNLDAPTTGVAGNAGSWTVGGGSVTGDATTAGGSIVFNVGVDITTQNAVASAAGDYNDGAYAGSFDVIVSY